MNRNRKTVRGSAMVEFAIVAPLMVMLVFGITELGRALYQLNMITKSANTGARYLARVNKVVDLVYSEGSDLLESCTTGSKWDTATDIVRNLVLYGNETGTGKILLPGLTVEFDPMPHVTSPIDDGVTTSGCVISVKVATEFVSVFGDETLIPFTDIQPITFAEVAQERYIGE